MPPGVPVPRTFSGPRLRDQRRLAGLSVHDVAARIGRSCWSVYAYERGHAVPPIPVADAIADALGLPLDRFLADDRQAVGA
ncbi:helix-turn-helix domain-containing protein [Streptomyces sp. NBC_01235]|uniref:helix-turn-helix domain-containing protein n=1 Tax=Streptomyces sp. NBC_01235 TaxID=2903788 RepID=UPI002E1473D8|nr:helix-turn-helix domain-containing protein [Streptomyces sp. NBC_01235]